MADQMVIRFTWTMGESVELYRKSEGEEPDIVLITDPVDIADFTDSFMDFMKKEGGV